LRPGKTTVKNLNYYSGTDSTYWLSQCLGLRTLRLVESFPFVELLRGKLILFGTPPDLCTRLEIKHEAPDHSTFINVFYLHMVSKSSVTFEACSPQQGNCYPNLESLSLQSTAGKSKIVTLFKQDSLGKYLSTCKDALFDLNDGPSWLSIADSAFLVIDAPNEVTVPGTYSFYIGIWEMTLEVNAPCTSTYLQGLTEQGRIAAYIDELIVLVVAFELDAKEHSWEKACGFI